ncbi:hypothetical protein M0802_008081 [Mischocyttarus mexicanus]|nr:hypothetical protein M0802_008081 [Mischocyttarus mexicanus]
MTRFKIQRMKFDIFLSIFLLGQIAVCSGTFRERKSTGHELVEKKTLSKETNVQHSEEPSSSLSSASSSSSSSPPKKVIDDGKKLKSDDNKPPTDITSKLPPEVSDVTIKTTLTSKEHTEEGHQTSLNSGALLRGFYVFIGLSILVMAYIVFRNLRLSKTRAQMIRKYGILAHRQDVEMRPLPLEEEDDEDTTVFDASNVLTNNAQHLNL